MPSITATLLIAVLSSSPAGAQPLIVAAASDLQTVLPAIAAQFERDTGGKVSLAFGSSGNFYTQIQNGAPFDVFLSADIDYPRRLEAAGLAERGSVVSYAVGRIVLWTRTDSGVDLHRGLTIVGDARVEKIAIANPDHAPYGRAAVAALRHDGLLERARAKFVLGENISQAAQFAQSGNADVGILALSLALTPAMTQVGTYVEIPAASHPPIEQAAMILARSPQKALAKQFVEALQRPAAIRLLQTHGFSIPAAAKQ